MLIKIIGSIMVITTSSYLGYFLSRNCSKRPYELRQFQTFMQIIENEISFMSNLLPDIFKNIYRLSDGKGVANIFNDTVINLSNNSGVTISCAWEKSIKDNINKTALNKEDEVILLNFGKTLGSTDVEGQISNIRLTLNQLKNQEQKAEEYKKKNAPIYRSLGVLLGLAVVIILF